MPKTTSPTVPLYLRIPVGLRERLDEAASNGNGYIYKGAIADTAIKALYAGLDVIAPPPTKTKTTKKAK